ncbi:MAG TPA: amidohydrolase family protein [Dehalococcoidia bacterium]|nr:amidohydrolase family protein [Dehalococcoidia bacterium]
MIVDSHVHLFDVGYFPPKWHDITAERWAKAALPNRNPEDVRGRIEGGLIDPDASLLIGELDRAGIDTGICLTLDWGWGIGDTSGASPEQMMRHYGDLQRSLDGRFLAIAGVDPRRPGSLELYERAIKEFGLRGLKIYPPTGFYPYDDFVMPFYEKSLELNVPVYIHTALYPTYPLRPRFSNPVGVTDVQAAFPELTIIMAHSGFPSWGDEAIAVAQQHPNTYLEISNWDEIAEHDPGRVIHFLAEMRDRVGALRMLFGSDHIGGSRFSGERSRLPFWASFIRALPEDAPKYGKEFSQNEVDLILGGNAQRIFNL